MENLKRKQKNLENLLNLGFLVDTSFLIEYAKKRKLEKLIGNYISTITLLEFLRYFKESAKRREMKRLLEEIFKIVNIDNNVLLVYCEIYQKLKEKGKFIGDADLLIAFTAISKDLTLLTKDVKHFERLKEFGLKVGNDI